MRSITQYILRQLVMAMLFVTFGLSGVVWLSQTLRFVDLIVNRGLSFLTFVNLTLLLLPALLGIILPIALFCAVVYTYHRISIDGEIVVLRATGMSDLDLARPALILAAAIALICYSITLFFMPLGLREFKDRQFLIRSDYSQVLLREGSFTSLADKLTVYVRARQSNGELLGILVHDNRDPDTPVTILAERGAVIDSADGPRFFLVNGNRQEMEREGRKLSLLYFDRYSFDLSNVVPSDVSRWREPRERYLHEIFGSPRNRGDADYRRELRAEGHQRLVSPLYTVVFALIGLATILGGEFNRRGRLTRMLFGAGAAILFQGLAFAIANTIVKLPLLTPLVYANVGVSAGAALYVLLRGRTLRYVSVAGFEAGGA